MSLLVFCLYYASSSWHHVLMIPFIALFLFLFVLVVWGCLLVFSVAAGVASSPLRISLYSVLALLPVTLTYLWIPGLMRAFVPVYSVPEVLIWCFVAYLVIHGLTRLFVYLYNH